jgi:hypothetical protein
MKNVFKEKNPYGVAGVFLYIALCAPVIRSLLFGGGLRILDRYSGDLTASDGEAFTFFTKFVLYVPYLINEHIFRHFDVFNINILVIVTCIPIVYRYFSFSEGWRTFFLLAFLFLPVPLVTLSTFTKDYILVICLFFSYGYSSNGTVRTNWMLFFLYSFFLRAYLVIVPYLLSSKKNTYHYAGILLIAFLLLNTEQGSDVLFRLFNRRMADQSFEANSEIEQTVYVKSFFDIVYMLFEVLPQIIFPVFYNMGMKSIFFQTYVWTLLLISVYFRSKYSNVMLVMFILYVIIDPDLGAFIRHISSFFILFPLLMGLKGRQGKN